MELKYFHTRNFTCSCGCGQLPKVETMRKADEIREKLGDALVVTSGARCQAKQDKLILQGLTRAKRSKHISGDAIDLAPYIAREEKTKAYPQFNLEVLQAMKKLHDFMTANAEELGIWVEDPNFTSMWCHFQIVPYPSWVEGKSRVFKP